MEQELFYIRDFCKCYAISRTAVYREFSANRLHHIKRGTRTLIHRAEAERWVEALRKQAPPTAI